MSFIRLLIVALLFGSWGCGETEPRTKLTYRLEGSAMLRQSLATLRIFVRSDEGDKTQDFTRAELKWPVEIVVVPADGNRSTREVTLTARAFDANNALITEQSERARFTPRQNRVITLMLVDTRAGEPQPEPEPPDELDGGPARDAGARDASAPDATATIDAAPAVDAGPAAPPDSEPPPRSTCTADTTFACDDGNPCNGVERCDPGNPAGDADGCVAGSDPVRCAMGSTCDRQTGMCSACLVQSDGDGDGVNSMSCGGMDCNDGDAQIAPGKPELCDGVDQDCDGTVDEQATGCVAPRGGSAMCVAGACMTSCTMAGQQIENGVCVSPAPVCPLPNPCAPGTCTASASGYTCACGPDAQTGVGASRCVASGSPRRSLGFELGCDERATPGNFVNQLKTLPSMLFAPCGLASVTNVGMAPTRLIQPGAETTIDGLVGTVALVGAPGLAFSFAPGVHEVSFSALDIDNPVGLEVRFVTAATPMPAPLLFPTLPPSKQVAVVHSSVEPITRVEITYTPLTPDDAWYVDELQFLVRGCGDGVTEGAEACDDGNDVQCDGCDNACAVSAVGCLRNGQCVSGMMGSGPAGNCP